MSAHVQNSAAIADSQTSTRDAPDVGRAIPPNKSAEPSKPTRSGFTALDFGIYLLIGTVFGIILIKSEVVSWFRIQEMFRFDSFHMYGIIGSAVVVAGISLQLMKRLGIKTFRGESIVMPPKEWGKGVRYWLGGSIFGFGWALLGACPGPIFALLGGGVTVMIVALAAALLGTYAYAYLRPRLPH